MATRSNACSWNNCYLFKCKQSLQFKVNPAIMKINRPVGSAERWNSVYKNDISSVDACVDFCTKPLTINEDRTGTLWCRCYTLPTKWFKSVLPYFVISFSYKEIAQSFSSLTSRYSTRPSCKKSSKLLVKTKQKYHIYKRPRTKTSYSSH